MKLLQINTVVNSGSTGKIAEEIGKLAMANNNESYIAYGRGERPSKSELIKIGTQLDVYEHGFQTLIFDRHGLASKRATKDLIRAIEKINPDVIGLHNLHGYYLNYPLLFQYLKAVQKPVVWTFHDCWPFTGHCSYFDRVDCKKWQTHCQECPLTRSYPKSIFKDNSFNNFDYKKEAFMGLNNLQIITPSKWLKTLVGKSFLNGYPVEVVHNGVDLAVFRPMEKKESPKKNIILGVASIWDERKGLKDFLKLREKLPKTVEIVLIGLSQVQIKKLPPGIKGIQRTENIEVLVKWYNKASVFVNPTYVDNFPTTNIEALACGTPVITYNTGGSPEAIDVNTGEVVEKGNIKDLVVAIQSILKKDSNLMAKNCRERAERLFDKEERFQDYLDLYSQMLTSQNENSIK